MEVTGGPNGAGFYRAAHRGQFPRETEPMSSADRKTDGKEWACVTVGAGSASLKFIRKGRLSGGPGWKLAGETLQSTGRMPSSSGEGKIQFRLGNLSTDWIRPTDYQA